jgi:lipopolysaccharide/colanic/teichoic acid biosynthesis glycosyltransferase
MRWYKQLSHVLDADSPREVKERLLSRIVNVCVAALLLVVLAPLLALVAGSIWLSGAEPVLYQGDRVGRNGRLFRILKFRTMTVEGAIKRDLTTADDPRITRLGRLLRRTKLDELPQLINVLRGEMSVVGPRPESPRYVVHYTGEERAVFMVRPGITGASQVLFRHEERMLSGPDPEAYYIRTVMPAKLAVDLAYVRCRSIWLDLKVIALTVLALVYPERAPWGPLRIRLGSTSFAAIGKTIAAGLGDGSICRSGDE